MTDYCIFINYSNSVEFAYPERAFISELSKIFTKVIVTSNNAIEPSLLNENVSVIVVKNEGYDLGMFYKALKTINLQNASRIALINNSNILLGDLKGVFEKGAKLKAPFWGLIDSYEKPWFSTHINNHHLQSHFLVWEKQAISLLHNYLESINIHDFFAEHDQKKLRRKVINEWEIGLSRYFVTQGFILSSVFEHAELVKNYKHKVPKNFTMADPEWLLKNSYPFLKKKFVQKQNFLKTLFHPNKNWKNLICTYNSSSVKTDALIHYFSNKI
ncbi:hypothetical protein BCY91_12795 [Pelobium manganitolerans]|uniref:Uncharacterized protein n=1 Tax=Pelobium manganitolerans TaxID=1842495 RepID=A0A419SAZ7_9SPHI|nr:rhamnan synthesis F family protein [Pelobium manganitolerans]RKD19478.1 hypothetical protein BCY91_12795 [Pelobium manganitolerans]